MHNWLSFSVKLNHYEPYYKNTGSSKMCAYITKKGANHRLDVRKVFQLIRCICVCVYRKRERDLLVRTNYSDHIKVPYPIDIPN